MRDRAVGFSDQNDTVPPRGERVAAYVQDYLATHPGLSPVELAFRLRVDKRDLRRLLQLRSCGHRLEDSLAAYFGDDFVEAVFRPVVGNGPSQREKELERERSEIAARRERLERDRARSRQGRPEASPVLRMVRDQGGGAAF